MTPGEFARKRLRRAREEKGLSQREIADLLGITQATVSDLERGRVQITVDQLAKFARLLDKPFSYFFPSALDEGLSERAAQVLDVLSSLPEDWQKRIVVDVNRQAELYRRVQPYIRAGIPEEFYGMLLWEKQEELELAEVDWESGEDFNTVYERYSKWKAKVDAARQST